MQRIFWFFFTYRAFILFVLLEIFCGWLIVKNNTYQGAYFYNSSTKYTADVLRKTQDVKDYFNLKTVNGELARENARLHQLYQQSLLSKATTQGDYKPDSVLARRFQFIAAKVIKNSTVLPRNYLTLDKGTLDGIKPDMGVISPQGVVGKVTACSDHYSVVTSILHLDYKLSSQIKQSGSIGMVEWDGKNSQVTQMKFVPKYTEVKTGDTVVTSSYNSVFPQGILVGTVTDVKTAAAETTYDLQVQTATDFNRLSYVYIINNIFKEEQESLEKKTIPPNAAIR
jgi:rod shape-determining protein MreC